MARWYGTGLDGQAFGAVLYAPDRRQALDKATATYGDRVFGVVSVPDWELHLAEQAARQRAKDRE